MIPCFLCSDFKPINILCYAISHFSFIFFSGLSSSCLFEFVSVCEGLCNGSILCKLFYDFVYLRLAIAQADSRPAMPASLRLDST